jgi:hypothetical protein
VEPSTKEWVDSCTQFGFLPIDPEDCAAKFASRALGNVFDKTVISHAAGIYPIPLTGDYTTRDPVCLAWRVSRKSPLYRHEPELASSWTDPNLQQDNSLVAPGSPNLRWQKGGLLHPSFWDVPLRCGKDRLVYLDSGPVVVLQG